MSKVVYLLMVLPFILIFGVLILVLALKDNAAQKKLLETVNDEEKERLIKEKRDKKYRFMFIALCALAFIGIFVYSTYFA